MQLRYLENIILQKATRTKQPNGDFIDTYTDVKEYRVQVNTLYDAVSASVYGSTLNKVYRISSPLCALETYLQDKVNNSEDNISQYAILYRNSIYKIVAVKDNWIDIEHKED